MTIIFVFGEMALSNWSKSMVHSEAELVLVAPSFGGVSEQYTILPPGI